MRLSLILFFILIQQILGITFRHTLSAYIPDPFVSVDFVPSENKLLVVGTTPKVINIPPNLLGPFVAKDGFIFQKDNVLELDPAVSIKPMWTMDVWIRAPVDEAKSLTLIKGEKNGLVVIHKGLLGTFVDGKFNPTLPPVKISTLSMGWHRLTVVCRRARQAFYIDGVRQGTTDIAVDKIVSIGGLPGGTEAFGAVARFRIYNLPLTRGQIDSLPGIDAQLNTNQELASKNVQKNLIIKAEAVEAAARQAEKARSIAEMKAKAAQADRMMAEQNLEAAHKARLRAEQEATMATDARSKAQQQESAARSALGDTQKEQEEEKMATDDAAAKTQLVVDQTDSQAQAQELKLVKEVQEVREEINREAKEREAQLARDEQERVKRNAKIENELKEAYDDQEDDASDRRQQEITLHRQRLEKLEKEATERREKLIAEEMDLQDKLSQHDLDEQQKQAQLQKDALRQQTSLEQEEKDQLRKLEKEEKDRTEKLRGTRTDELKKLETEETSRREKLLRDAENAMAEVERREAALRAQTAHYAKLHEQKQLETEEDVNALINSAKDKLNSRTQQLSSEADKRQAATDAMARQRGAAFSAEATTAKNAAKEFAGQINSLAKCVGKQCDGSAPVGAKDTSSSSSKKDCKNRGPLGRKDVSCT